MSNIEIIKTADGSDTLFNKSLNETYHSRRGAIEESQYVYIDRGLKMVYKNPIKVLEIGLGTGLNVMLTCLNAEKEQLNVCVESLEPFPIEEFKELNYCDELNFSKDTFNQIHSSKFGEYYELSKWVKLKKIKSTLESFIPEHTFDVIYFDAFAPSKQPEVWNVSNLKKCYDSLLLGGVLTTYCAQGQFKRDLKSVGFSIENPPGPLGKKEMTIATKKG